MNFHDWYHEVADMPKKVDGRWIDLETGIAFSDDKDVPLSRNDLRHHANLDAAKEIRKTSKALGGKALTGTAAQKKWAEDIRKKALEKFPLDFAQDVLEVAALQSSKWWIENRSALTQEKIAPLVESYKAEKLRIEESNYRTKVREQQAPILKLVASIDSSMQFYDSKNKRIASEEIGLAVLNAKTALKAIRAFLREHPLKEDASFPGTPEFIEMLEFASAAEKDVKEISELI